MLTLVQVGLGNWRHSVRPQSESRIHTTIGRNVSVRRHNAISPARPTAVVHCSAGLDMLLLPTWQRLAASLELGSEGDKVRVGGAARVGKLGMLVSSHGGLPPLLRLCQRLTRRLSGGAMADRCIRCITKTTSASRIRYWEQSCARWHPASTSR